MPEQAGMRAQWTNVLEMTGGLPGTVPPRADLEGPVAELRLHVEGLVRDVEAYAAHDADTADRETARWLLVKVRQTLSAPADDDRQFALVAEDLALACRALASLADLMTPAGARP